MSPKPNRPTGRRAPAAEPVTPPRTFGYVRVSSDMQVERGQSLEAQQERLGGWAKMSGRQFDRIVIEAGTSAYKVEFAKRPEGGKLLEELRRGDMLVGVTLDRMFRDARDCQNTVHVLRERGVSFRLLDLGGGQDELTANGLSAFFLQVMAAVAQLESVKISERIKATKARQKAAGEWSGGAAPFGWRISGARGDRDRKLVAVPEQQQALQRMREMRAEGASSRKISAALAEMGHSLSHISVQNILNREQ